ncbi:Transcriptional regulator, TetR family [Pseudonocardia sp. Ae406_Ps2]|uniref:TetR/AcrR family transcriptional regulator n=1 Tax=unclassified Pseudonocardia TaxID=2619320 RepID=UPI00094AC6B1|nr:MULTISPECIES: TetR/AcrR family transcriptional regulator [unclassified Pseudonocardia]OLM01262.1 Transcriptional regulator, TetR family [Pseudonocardia sp. Ae406_Ps2]OLM06941.1 Transcriptional regulator, TetR family [Pseudonocardia sp. Ae331_Ps2]OLM22836.1 Transcriptional regulator, TetR family [Pseudonocardia sp. Ae706_Ps2]
MTAASQPDPVDTTTHIARTALGLFLEHGYEQVTVDAIAAAAGVSRRTVFRHFESKDEIPFADHAERRERARVFLAAPGRGVDPVRDVIEATEYTLADFLSDPDLVLHRYRLTRVVPRLAEREILEHERYLVHSRRHLRLHLPSSSRTFEPMAIAALIDGMHRSALGDWICSGGTTDAMADLRSGTRWAQRALAAATDDAVSTSLLAVVPNTPTARRLLQELVTLDAPDRPHPAAGGPGGG